jgi:hypothetical protein
MPDKKHNPKKTKPAPSVVSPPLLDDLRRMIEETRKGVAVTVNAGLTMLYWRVGKRINEEILKGERADYGKEILATVSQELIRGYGNGFGEKNLRRMIQFAEVFPDEKIVVSLIRELSWTHFIALIPLEKPLQRDFYAEMCRIERWSVRTLRQKISSMLYERTVLSKKPEELARIELEALRDEDKLTVELKLGKFRPEHMGQMELYLRWLDKYERQEGESAPIGMILCAGKKQEQIELLELDKSGIHVAEYLTDSLPKEVLQAKLRKAVAIARKRLENRGGKTIADNGAATLLEGE